MSASIHRAELPQHPVMIADEQTGLNAAIAAALTRCVGSMPALYAVLVFVGGWMALATWGPLRRADPYPFAFLLFLDNVVQLVLCSVILVGQRVLGNGRGRQGSAWSIPGFTSRSAECTGIPRRRAAWRAATAGVRLTASTQSTSTVRPSARSAATVSAAWASTRSRLGLRPGPALPISHTST